MPVFMPLFALTVFPALFRGRRYNMTELEASTRASGAQIVLAKLVLAGGANLVCLTLLLCLEFFLNASPIQTGRLILYAIVPYLICMTVLLRSMRLQKYKIRCPLSLKFLLSVRAGALCQKFFPNCMGPPLQKYGSLLLRHSAPSF